MTDLLIVTLFEDLEKLKHDPLLLHCTKEGTSAGERERERERERESGWHIQYKVTLYIPEPIIEVESYVLPHKESRLISLLHSAWTVC